MKARSDPLHVVVPGRLDQVTGGYLYDARIVSSLRSEGRRVIVHELPGRFPLADRIARGAAQQALDRIGRAPAVIDGLALPAFAGLLDGARNLIALVHHPVSLETGLTPARRQSLARTEAAILSRIAGTIVTSPTTVADVVALGADASRVRVVVPGTARAPRRARHAHAVVRLLIVASFTPRKGHGVLLKALAQLRGLRWRLDCIGSLCRDPEVAQRLRAEVRFARLGRRVRFLGERKADALDRRYARSDLFVLPSFHEGYGMAFAEAIRRAVPILGTTAGAIPTTVPRAAGVLVSPGDARALARVLSRMLQRPRLRRRLAQGALAWSRRLPEWPDQGRSFAAALDDLLG